MRPPNFFLSWKDFHFQASISLLTCWAVGTIGLNVMAIGNYILSFFGIPIWVEVSWFEFTSGILFGYVGVRMVLD